jgi:hypothetical protein
VVRQRAAVYESRRKPVHAGSNPVPGSKLSSCCLLIQR